jgi:hypothetical protein
VSERTFDRRIEFDERSRDYPVRALLEPKPLRSYTWGCPVRLDQKKEGACVGFAWTHELASRPKTHGLVTEALARDVYHQAQYRDPWPETPPEEGTSILAGAKEAVARGFIGEYRWCFSVYDLALAVGYSGPVVLGLNWRSNMMQTDGSGYIHATGPIVGGHAILCNGYSVTYKRFRLVNSWGASWGQGGSCFVSEADMATLLADEGEACVPVTRYLLEEWRA